MRIQHILPGDIERTSMSIIASELAERGAVLPPEHEAVIKRVIHTTADFDYVRSLRFTPRAVELGALTEAHELAEPLWDSLNEGNKVSLYVRLIDLNGGGPDSYIINKHS